MRRLKQFGCHLVSVKNQVEEILRDAVLLDGYGFDLIIVGDHTLLPNSSLRFANSQVLLTAMAMLTKKVKLSTGVTDSYRRHPVEIAHWIATQDHLTKGRAILGIGGGEMMNLAPFGIEWNKPYTRLREAIDVIKLLWEATPTKPANYEGEVFRLRGAYLQETPLQKPHPPLYIGAVGPRMRELAGEIADGWFPIAAESPDTLRDHISEVGTGLQRFGRKMEGFDIAVTLYTSFSDDDEQAYRDVEKLARSILVWERGILKKHAGIEIPADLSVQRMVADSESAKRIEQMGALIPRKLVEDMVAFGSVEQCIKKCEKFLDAGATSILITNHSSNEAKTYEVYAKQIMPYLRQEYGIR